MEFGNVSGAAITAMVVVAVVTILLPVILVIVGKVKLGAKLSSFFIGCGVFFVMTLVLEQILHAVVLTITGTKLTDNIWLYALYGGCAAAVFEETGRWFAMKHFLKKNLDFPNAVMYGIGHGGFEAIVVGGITYIGNIVSALSINSGMMEKAYSLWMLRQNSRHIQHFSLYGQHRLTSFIWEVLKEYLQLFYRLRYH